MYKNELIIMVEKKIVKTKADEEAEIDIKECSEIKNRKNSVLEGR